MIPMHGENMFDREFSYPQRFFDVYARKEDVYECGNIDKQFHDQHGRKLVAEDLRVKDEQYAGIKVHCQVPDGDE